MYHFIYDVDAKADDMKLYNVGNCPFIRKLSFRFYYIDPLSKFWNVYYHDPCVTHVRVRASEHIERL